MLYIVSFWGSEKIKNLYPIYVILILCLCLCCIKIKEGLNSFISSGGGSPWNSSELNWLLFWWVSDYISLSVPITLFLESSDVSLDYIWCLLSRYSFIASRLLFPQWTFLELCFLVFGLFHSSDFLCVYCFLWLR